MEIIRFFQLQGNPVWYHHQIFFPRQSAEASLLSMGNKGIVRNAVTHSPWGYLEVLCSWFVRLIDNNYSNNSAIWWVPGRHITQYNHPNFIAIQQ